MGILPVILLLALGLSLQAPAKVPSAGRLKNACASRLTTRLAESERVPMGPAEAIEILPGVYYLQFESQEELASTFLRFQEHYESPEFRGKIFSLEEYRQWYIAQRGAFTYYEDWSGFNIPSFVLEPFYDGKFNPLTEKEQRIVELFRPLRGRKFYIIGAYREPGTALDPHEIATVHHEAAHSFFYMDDEYRREILDVLAGIDARPVHAMLADRAGYHPSVFDDETHAYLMTAEDAIEEFGIDLAPYRTATARMHAIFARHLAARARRHRDGSLVFPPLGRIAR